jgi:hypothetical protein
MDTKALIAGLFGAGIGAAVCYLLVGRDWLAASGGPAHRLPRVAHRTPLITLRLRSTAPDPQ